MAATVFRPGATALITGAGSGIGFAFAKLCRTHGMNLALVDINAANITAAGALLKSSKEKTETYTMDVSSAPDWTKLRSDVEKAFGSIDLLMLNAGASFKPSEGKSSWEDPEYFQKTFSVNVFGLLNGIAAFLPLVEKNVDSSAIVITGSKQGITNPPGNPAYNASKATAKSITEHLSHDLKKSNPSISVHLLIPGWTYTGFSGNKGPISDEEAMEKKPKGAWLPSQVAEYGYRKMGEGKFYIMCPDDDVTEELDQARMSWGAGDWVDGRPALSRWDEKVKGEAAEWIKAEAERRSGKM